MEENSINFTVKFTTQIIPVTISHDSTVQRLKTLLLPLTNVFPPFQKLIFKGRILENDKTLRESGINNGVTIMLVGTKGLHIWNDPMMRKAPSPITMKTNVGDDNKFKVDESCIKRWKATNIVSLAERNLKGIPDEVWSYAPFIRILDISQNSIQRVPGRIDCLAGLRKLVLDGNGLSDESIKWQGLTCLNLLQYLSLNKNCLKTLPCSLGRLTSLLQLHVADNELIALPNEIGFLAELEVLKVNHNRISSIPSTIGNCTSLIEVDLSSNHLSELPDRFCSLHNLKALHLSNNALKSLPYSLFTMCTRLLTLVLHNTEITMDTLEQLEGWEDFVQRRRARRQKQTHFRVFKSAESDEDADKN
ncbi:LRR repeats and ubiquitin-like domain-containing protein At2g30105 [Mangifera indica]|uniref:LRR repeats and ubiquitin-like domain-containing protein At2g30105 n=1 Tax=Mangifera indica TaxID=29780 RepID=UPI001CFA8494|nr:LRR repeats and ubiquitin-like domain-containing protein At2g30105 [Mangifera indica]